MHVAVYLSGYRRPAAGTRHLRLHRVAKRLRREITRGMKSESLKKTAQLRHKTPRRSPRIWTTSRINFRFPVSTFNDLEQT